MKMKKSLMMMIVILSAAAFADEWVWVGGSSSTWTSNDAPYANNANNWTNRLTGARGFPNSANDIAVFDGTGVDIVPVDLSHAVLREVLQVPMFVFEFQHRMVARNHRVVEHQRIIWLATDGKRFANLRGDNSE